MTYIQAGRNDKYPKTIETWRFGEQPIPEWFSDVCKVIFIDALGNKTLGYRETNTGGIEFIGTEGTKIILSLKNKKDYVCYGDRRIFALSETQLNLLYKEKKK